MLPAVGRGFWFLDFETRLAVFSLKFGVALRSAFLLGKDQHGWATFQGGLRKTADSMKQGIKEGCFFVWKLTERMKRQNINLKIQEPSNAEQKENLRKGKSINV